MSRTPGETVAEELARTRERKGITQQQMSERLENLGVHLDRTAIGKIETGKRSVTVDEMFALAAALRVSPITLLIPRSERDVEVTPQATAAANEVQQWIRGRRFLFPDENEATDLRYFYEDALTDAEAAAYREHPNLRTIVEIVSSMLEAAIVEADGGPQSPFQPVYGRALVNLGFWAQREWMDLGGKGHVGKAATPAAREAAVKQLFEQPNSFFYDDQPKED